MDNLNDVNGGKPRGTYCGRGCQLEGHKVDCTSINGKAKWYLERAETACVPQPPTTYNEHTLDTYIKYNFSC